MCSADCVLIFCFGLFSLFVEVCFCSADFHAVINVMKSLISSELFFYDLYKT